jgi:hypothetical protein
MIEHEIKKLIKRARLETILSFIAEYAEKDPQFYVTLNKMLSPIDEKEELRL